MSETSVLLEAQEAVFGERAKTYGHPKENFKRIADLWNAYFVAQYPGFGPPAPVLEPVDVAQMMILMKMARLVETPNHRDSWVDIAGYAETGARVLGLDE